RSAVTAKQAMLTSGARKGTYAQFATAAAEVKLAEEPKIKEPGNWWLLGQPLARLDVPVKVNGSAAYAIDTELDNMVYAAAKNTPVPWGRLVSYDTSAIKDRPGIFGVIEFRAVDGKRDTHHLQDAIAVVADTWYRARTAIDLIKCEWDFGTNGDVSDATQEAQAKHLWETSGPLSNQTANNPPAMIPPPHPLR